MTNGPKKDEGSKDEGCYVFPLYFLGILRLTDWAPLTDCGQYYTRNNPTHDWVVDSERKTAASLLFFAAPTSGTRYEFWIIHRLPQNPDQRNLTTNTLLLLCCNRAHISGRQTPCLTRGSSPLVYNKCGGVNPGLNPGFCVRDVGPGDCR
jgi:hypothetical protein